MTKRIPVPRKDLAILQQENNSICPFCRNKDVGHFQAHHINENRSNNNIENLILVCPLCHSKIHKNDISRAEVLEVKSRLQYKNTIECTRISIDTDNCSWTKYNESENVFFFERSDKNLFPIFSFSMINHSDKTILLNEIQLKAKHLPVGISGIPEVSILKSIAKYQMQLPEENEITSLVLPNEIEIPPQRAFKFEVEVFQSWNNESQPIKDRKILYFTLAFNGTTIQIPYIYLNCKNEDEKSIITILQ